MAFDHLCMNCMKDIGEEKQCPYCGYNADSPQLPPYLPQKTTIGGRYIVGNVIESNGDGISYIAYDTEKKSPVVVREFLPDTIATRTTKSTDIIVKPGSERLYSTTLGTFLEMWRKLARMRGLSALILVIDIFEENNTAYAICEYIEGAVTLREYLLSNKAGYISWEEARILLMPVLSTLATIHSSGIIHRGISPNTLYVCPDHKVRIAGFSIPEARNVGTGIAAEIFSGYAPVEQLGVDAVSGPWTDIYAFAAVLYRSLIGSTPIDAKTRMTNDRMMIPAKFAEQIPAYVINAMINALQIMPEDRTKTVDQLREELSASPTAAIAAEYEAEPQAPVPQRAPAPAPQRKKKPKKSAAQIRKEKQQATIKAAAISAAVLIFIFVILCCTVLRGHFSTSTVETETTTSEAEMVTVPSFTDMTESSINSQKSFFVDLDIEFQYAYSDTITKGYIISQSIEANSSVAKKSKIILVVSEGKETLQMPNVIGMTFEEAKALLEQVGFTNITSKDYNESGIHEAGTVAKFFDTSIKVGEYYEKDKEIKLAVYIETETTTK